MPSAFISYSWDSEEHKQWVLELATRLRKDGVETILDQWHVVPGDRLPTFMESAVRDSDYVLIICTPRYKEKADRRQGGVGYEEDIITGEVLTTRYERKFIPILRSGDVAESTPTWVIGKYHIDLRGNPFSETQYKTLATTLLGTRAKAPPVISPYDPDAASPGPSKGASASAGVIAFDAKSPPEGTWKDSDFGVAVGTTQFERIRLEVHQTRRGYVQDEKEIVTFSGRKLYAGVGFRGPCEVYQKDDGTFIFYYESWGKMVYARYSDLNEAKRAWKNGYPVHDHEAVQGAADAIGFELELDERQI